jgi:hypothetical protein
MAGLHYQAFKTGGITSEIKKFNTKNVLKSSKNAM